MIDMSDYRVYIKRLNDKFTCISNYTSDGKYRIGPGVIYPTMSNAINFQYRFIERFDNGKKYGRSSFKNISHILVVSFFNTF